MFSPDFVPSKPNKKDHPSIANTEVSLASFLRPSPWLLVPTGSYNGYFDWVNEGHRVGRWSIGSILALPAIVMGLILHRPTTTHDEQSSFTSIQYSNAYVCCYNAIATGWMVYVLQRNIRQEGWAAPYTTFTLWNWTMLLLRHALLTVLVLLDTYMGDCEGICGKLEHFTIRLAANLRGPCLLNAVVVFVVWNCLLAPGIYLTMTPEQRHKFLQWTFQFNLLNQHGLVLPLAVANTLLIDTRPLEPVDLWWGLVTVVAYLLFYLLVLDRIGVHLYPVFSPRTWYCPLVWVVVLVGYCLLFWWTQGATEGSILERFHPT